MVIKLTKDNLEDIDNIISNALFKLANDINKEGFNIEIEDLDWGLFSDYESLAIKSYKLYPEEDLPRMFGVERGVQSDLEKSDVYKMSKHRQAKANRILDLFVECFNQIMDEKDKLK